MKKKDDNSHGEGRVRDNDKVGNKLSTLKRVDFITRFILSTLMKNYLSERKKYERYE